MAGRGENAARRPRPPPPPPRGRGSPQIGRARPPLPPRGAVPRPPRQSLVLSESDLLLSSSGSDEVSKQGVQPPGHPIASPDITTISARLEQFSTGDTQTSFSTMPQPSKELQGVSDVSDGPKLFRGNSGSKINVSCNYLKLTIDQDMGVFHYAVTFKPAVDSTDQRHRLLNQQRKLFDGGIKVFDGTALFVRKLLEGGDQSAFSTDDMGAQFQLTFNFKRKCKAGEPKVVQLYNILFGRIFRVLKFSQHKRKYFDSHGAHLIPQHSINVWPGYVTAADQYEGGLLLQLDASFRVLRTQTVNDLFRSIKNKAQLADFKAEVEKQLIGTSVLTRYNNRSYVVDDIDYQSSPKDTFTNDKGEKMSYIDYYQNQYSMTIRDQGQPMLVSRMKTKSAGEEGTEKVLYLVPEFCLLTGMTDAMRADYKIMQEVAKYTRISPQKRIEHMANFVSRVNGSEIARQILADWGLHVNPTPLNLAGRILEPQIIHFGGNYSERVSEKGDWNRAATSRSVISPIQLHKWFIFFPARISSEVKTFCQTMIQQARRMGLNFAMPKPITLENDRNDTYTKELRGVIDTSVQLVLTVFPQMKADRYAAIKRLCCNEMPIPSQVVNLRTISNEKRLSAVCQKIALQINCKLGGELWGVKTPFKNLMVVGIDVYHEKSRRSGSVAGVVASLNDTQSRFYSTVVIQKEGQEMIDALTTAFEKALNRYKGANNCYPDEVVIFRDGVGDGQLETIRIHEAAQFRSVFGSLSPAPSSRDTSMATGTTTSSSSSKKEYKPGFSFIVVQKRINTRIFSAVRGTSNYENPPPGTVVDNTITRYNYKDFFLVPQSVNQGSVTPTHFVVIEESDNEIMNPDNVQKLAYTLTHMYYNWPGTVRVPAPCQYAHKLVELIGEHVKVLPKPLLEDRLYYL